MTDPIASFASFVHKPMSIKEKILHFKGHLVILFDDSEIEENFGFSLKKVVRREIRIGVSPDFFNEWL